MGFWKPLICQEAARMAEFSSFRFSAARRFLSWQMTVGNPWGGFRTAPAHFGHFWGSSGFDQHFAFFEFRTRMKRPIADLARAPKLAWDIKRISCCFTGPRCDLIWAWGQLKLLKFDENATYCYRLRSGQNGPRRSQGGGRVLRTM